MPHLGHVTIVVNDYDHAIDYYTCVLDFVVYEDRLLTPGKRWVLIGPAHRRGSGICSRKRLPLTKRRISAIKPAGESLSF